MGYDVHRRGKKFAGPVEFLSTVVFGPNAGLDLSGISTELETGVLAAAGSGQSTYAQIVDQVTIVTGADATKGVALPAADEGHIVIVINADASNVLPVAPINGGNDQINSLTASTGVFSMGPSRGAWFIPISATQWYVSGDAAIVGTPTEQDLDGRTATVAELNKLDDSVTVLTKGAGVSAAESYAVGYLRNGTLVTTRIVVDLTGLVGSATDLDIIGNTGGAASAHWGQITTALNGTMIGGQITCLEVPAGGADDIDFYSATVSTGAQDVDVTTLTETALVTAGGAWASGTVKGMTGLPAANDYLYIVNGEAAGGTFTAGKFLIELFGYVA